MFQNDLQYMLAKITWFNINNDKKEQNNWRKKKQEKKTNQNFRLKYAADSNGSISGNDVNAIYFPNNIVLIKTTVKDLRDVQ